MYYEKSFTVTAGTTAEDPKSVDIKLTKGIIHHWAIRFRRGTDFRVACKLYHGAFQILPTNRDDDIRDDGQSVEGDDLIRIDREPYIVTVKAWSPTCTYDHALRVRLWILDESDLAPYRGIFGGIKKFLNTLGIKV